MEPLIFEQAPLKIPHLSRVGYFLTQLENSKFLSAYLYSHCVFSKGALLEQTPFSFYISKTITKLER